MTKSITRLAWLIFIASAFGAVRCAAAERPDRNSSRLIGLAAGQFPNLTRAERAMLQYADRSNLVRGKFAVAGTSANPDDPSNDPAKADK